MKRIIVILSMILLTCMAYGGNIHFICFADTDDAKIGKGVAKDVNLMLDFVMTLATQVGMEEQMKPAIVMMGDDCNSRKLLSLLNDFKCGSDDVVIFYYSGHGVRSLKDASEFPQMCLGSYYQKDYVSLERVKEIIEKKGPKLSIILGDCCNSYSRVVLPKEGVLEAAAWPSRSSRNSKGLAKLFLETKGSVIAAGSSKGEYAWSNSSQGGFFTNGFLDEVEAYTASSGSSCDWQELMRRTRKRVVEYSRKALKDDGGYVQTPVFQVEYPGADPGPTTGMIPTIQITHPRLEDGINKALLTVSDPSISQNHRILHYKSVLKTFFKSSDSMIDMVGQDMVTLVNYTTADEYLLRLATGSTGFSGFRILEEKKDSDGKITYLKIKENYR